MESFKVKLYFTAEVTMSGEHINVTDYDELVDAAITEVEYRPVELLHFEREEVMQ